MAKYRSSVAGIVAIALAAGAAPLHADVKVQEKSLVKFTGMIGKMVGMFGGKAAREGVVSTIAVKGDRKARVTDKSEQIIDLQEEKIYEIDLEDKSYTVTTFAELRKKMEEARERAKEQAAKRSEREEKPEQKQDQPQYEVDFDLKDTGEKKTIAGFDTHQVIMTITVREKGKTLEESGGVVLTADTWLAPEMPETKEIAQFDLRYAQQLYGPMLSTQEMQQYAAALAAHPQLRDAMSRFQKEKGNLKGTPISTIVTFDGVQSKAQAEEQAQHKDAGEDDDKAPTSAGGLMGSFARKFGKKKAQEGESQDNKESAGGSKNRATIMTMTQDVLKIEPSATAADVAVPAGFKLKS